MSSAAWDTTWWTGSRTCSEAFARLPVTTAETPAEIRDLLGRGPLPARGTEPAKLLREEATGLLLEHSLFNGHPLLHGLYHVVARADRCAGRSARGRREPERGRMAAVARGV